MKTQLNDHNDRTVTLNADGANLFEYHYRNDIPAGEAPKPYFHPIRTLAGNTVTLYRPTDHPWHHALCMTITNVSGHNFWGGKTYESGEGYRAKSDHGRQIHTGWEKLEADGGGASMRESLDWVTNDGDCLFKEKRSVAVPPIDETSGFYIMDFEIDLENVAGRRLTLGNYHSSQGLEGSHYTGLHFRSIRGFFGARGGIFAAGGLSGEKAVHRSAAPWMALAGHHDTTLDGSTLIFIDQPGNPDYPNHWFIREGQVQAAFPFQYAENLELPPGDHLRLRHRIVIGNGAWTREEIEARIAAMPGFSFL